MLSALLAAVFAVVVYLVVTRSKKQTPEPSRDTTPALEAWLREALEEELSEVALGIRGASEQERSRLAKTLAHEPDADVVTRIEDKVRSVELEYVKYAHETDAEVSVRVRYQNGNTGTTTRRMALSDLPEGVRKDFDAKAATRVFRTWSFPWQRAVSL